MDAFSNALPDFTGCIVDKRYQLVKLLGSGAYGVVYMVFDMRAISDYNAPPPYRAMKIIRKADRDPAEVALLRREVALHSGVERHPNVLKVFEDKTWFYTVLDYHSGGNLFEQVWARRSSPRSRCATTRVLPIATSSRRTSFSTLEGI